MRLGLLLVVVACGQVAAANSAERQFPYTAKITTGEAHLRSGPGEHFYATAKLAPGAEIEIYREDPGGWCAIRPPEGSFSWVSGRYLKVSEDGLAEVTAERIPSCVGSDLSDSRDAIHVYLQRGELLEVLGSKKVGSGPSAVTWYKIAPPSGEFRWVGRKDIEQPITPSEVRNTSAETSTEPQPVQPAAPVLPENFQAALDQLNTELSATLAKEPAEWNCDDLARRTESLLPGARTDAEQGQVGVLLNRIAQARDVKQRHTQLAPTQSQTELASGQPAAASEAGESVRAHRTASSRFDAVGRLARVQPGKIGSPRYALVDDRGNVRSYVNPAPGVKMQHHLGRRIGVTGIRDTSEGRAPLVTAKHVTALDDQRMR